MSSTPIDKAGAQADATFPGVPAPPPWLANLGSWIWIGAGVLLLLAWLGLRKKA